MDELQMQHVHAPASGRNPLDDRLDDLWQPYPASPGYRGSGATEETSMAAAFAVAGAAKSLRERIFAAIQAAPGISSDEIAARLHLSTMQTRPRVAELHRG